jgi:hypothetical protein
MIAACLIIVQYLAVKSRRQQWSEMADFWHAGYVTVSRQLKHALADLDHTTNRVRDLMREKQAWQLQAQLDVVKALQKQAEEYMKPHPVPGQPLDKELAEEEDEVPSIGLIQRVKRAQRTVTLSSPTGKTHSALRRVREQSEEETTEKRESSPPSTEGSNVSSAPDVTSEPSGF